MKKSTIITIIIGLICSAMIIWDEARTFSRLNRECRCTVRNLSSCNYDGNGYFHNTNSWCK